MAAGRKPALYAACLKFIYKKKKQTAEYSQLSSLLIKYFAVYFLAAFLAADFALTVFVVLFGFADFTAFSGAISFHC